jgi:chemotaxis signal transduction protein
MLGAAAPPGSAARGGDATALPRLVSEAGKLRSAEMADPQPDALQVVLFRVAGTAFAVTADDVDQAQRSPGRHLPAFDLGAEIGYGASDTLVLALRTPHGRVRLLVDDVVEVTTLPLEQIYALPRLAAENHRGGYVSAVAMRGEELVVLLDADALVAITRDRRAAVEPGASVR